MPSVRRAFPPPVAALLIALPVLTHPGAPRAADLPPDALATLAWQIARDETHVAPERLAASIVERRAGLVVVDVRAAEDFAAGHVEGARNVPVPKLLDPAVMASLAREEEVVVYSTGTARAAQAVAVLRLAGVPALSLLGGWRHWVERTLDPAAATPDGETTDLATREAIARRLKDCPPLSPAPMPLCAAADTSPAAAKAPAPSIAEPPGPTIAAPPGPSIAEPPGPSAPADVPAEVPMILEGSCG